MTDAPSTVHAFTDDVLGDHDAVALAQLVKDGEVTPQELTAAAVARAEAVNPRLNGVVIPLYDNPRYAARPGGALYGVPTFIKDNTDLEGLPTGHGSEAFTAHPAKADGAYVAQYLSSGMTVLGKTRLPEFGLSASTEFMTWEPTRNPWHTDFTIGASSGGSAAFVAAGVVPIAHANDGGGSIRIPAACGGLVGLKPSRFRHIQAEQNTKLPVNMVSEGVVTRSVRDTAAFFAASEDHWRNPDLAPVGLVRGPSDRQLRVGLVLDSVTGPVDAETRAAIEQTASLLEKAGHIVEPIALPVDDQFVADFLQYWGLLADLLGSTGKLMLDKSFDKTKLDGVTLGLQARHRANLRRTPGAIRRLRKVKDSYAAMFAQHELVLSPVLAHVTPRLGFLKPSQDFDLVIERLQRWVAYTPLNNIAGTPGMSIPMGLSSEGLPIGIQLSGAYGDERTLLETAFYLEAEAPFARIQDR